LGASKLENDPKSAEICRRVQKLAKERNVELHLPSDFICAEKLEATEGSAKKVLAKQDLALDIGPETVAR